LTFSGAKPKIKKRITRAIASVINWLRVGTFNAVIAIIRTPFKKILTRQQVKNAIKHYLLPDRINLVNKDLLNCKEKSKKSQYFFYFIFRKA